MKKATALLLALLAFTLTFSGCFENIFPDISSLISSPEEIPENTYEEYFLRESCDVGGDFIFNSKIKACTVGSRKYEFENTFSNPEMDKFVFDTEKLFAYLSEKNIDTENFVIRVPKDYAPRADSKNKTVYLRLREPDHENVSAVLLAVFGEYTNYGYIYALSEKVCAGLGYEQDVNVCDNPDILKNDPALYNLVYPCFDEKYTSVMYIPACKFAAKQALGDMSDAFAGEDEFMRKVDFRAASLGVNFKKTDVRFAPGGQECDIRIRVKDLYIPVEKGFTERYVLAGTSNENYLIDVATMVKTFSWLSGKISELDSTVSPSLPEEARGSDITVCLSTSVDGRYDYMYGVTYGKGYFGSADCKATSALDLGYAYVYSLLYKAAGEKPTDWLLEALSYCFLYESAYEKRINNLFPESIGRNADDTYYSAGIGDYAEDELDFCHIICALQEDNTLYSYLVGHYYENGVSFCDCVKGVYGTDALIKLAVDPDNAKKYTGKTLTELINDWRKSIIRLRIELGISEGSL
ncbi:MAG: hypothetical protein KBS44_04675 [Clostridiales bacterium]|nr:hypothetical protein [Candidatus Coliplasma equi]